MRLVAVCGAPEDFESLRLARAPEELEALGFFGFVGSVPHLLDVLDSERHGVRSKRSDAAAKALWRLTAGPGKASNRAWLAAPKPPVDAARWRGFWSEHQRRFDESTRYRFGEPFEPMLCVEELALATVDASERRLLGIELAAWCDEPMVAVDRFRSDLAASLETCRAALAAKQVEPGRWLGERGRKAPRR
jgi:hypothetical protein